MSHVTKKLSLVDTQIAVADAVITSLAFNKIQIDSAGSNLTTLAVGDIVFISGSTGDGNNSIFRVTEELVADESYTFMRQGDDHDDTSTETVDAITLDKTQGLAHVDTIGLVLQFNGGTFSIQPKVSVDGKVFINEGSAVSTSVRVVISNHVNWIWLDVGSITGETEVAIGY